MSPLAALLLIIPPASLQTPIAGSAEVGAQFKQYTAVDKHQRTISFYISPTTGPDKPLALLILGSGGQSIWRKVDGKVGGGLQNLLLKSIGDRFRILVVEKPGVDLFFQPERPGTAEGSSRKFLEEHTLERWTEANLAAIRSCQSLPGVQKGGVLAIGHSEGGIVAAAAAARNPLISQVAVLAGGGPNQLEDLKRLMGPQAEEDWKLIQADPTSIEKFAWGHPYRRWSSFLATSTQEELLKSRAKVFMAAGTEDASVPVNSFDTGVATLRSRGREVEALRLEGADHGFRKPTDKSPIEGFEMVFSRIADWYFQSSAKAGRSLK